MAIQRTRKNKKGPHYGFLVSWDQNQLKRASVKGETKIGTESKIASVRHDKRADSLAQAEANTYVKRDLIRSIIIISLVLILELVVYLAWNRFMAK